MIPCKHNKDVVKQIGPAINLISNMDELHPDILKEHKINPDDYKNNLVFRSAVESIRGAFIASSKTGREGVISRLLGSMKANLDIVEYKVTASEKRHDFEIKIKDNYFVILDSKGGEGNSINISDRPLSANEFGLWCHLDGAIINDPSRGVQAILNRVGNEMIRKGKQVDFVIFKDALCGTPARPCPKYPGQEHTIGANAAPDIFIFPKMIPSLDDPEPPLYNICELEFPSLVLNYYDVPDYSKHTWGVSITIETYVNTKRENKTRRITRVYQNKKLKKEFKSRGW
jgi:hypothetical protein